MVKCILISVAVLVFFLFLLLQKITVTLDYSDEFLINIRYLFIKYHPKFHKKADKQDESQKTVHEKKQKMDLKLTEIFQHYKRFKPVVERVAHYSKKKLHVFGLSLQIEFGTGDAAQTAVATGAIWSVLYNIYGILDRYVSFHGHHFVVNPLFNRSAFEVKFHGIITIRLVHIINILFLLLLSFLKVKIQTRKG